VRFSRSIDSIAAGGSAWGAVSGRSWRRRCNKVFVATYAPVVWTMRHSRVGPQWKRSSVERQGLPASRGCVGELSAWLASFRSRSTHFDNVRPVCRRAVDFQGGDLPQRTLNFMPTSTCAPSLEFVCAGVLDALNRLTFVGACRHRMFKSRWRQDCQDRGRNLDAECAHMRRRRPLNVSVAGWKPSHASAPAVAAVAV